MSCEKIVKNSTKFGKHCNFFFSNTNFFTTSGEILPPKADPFHFKIKCFLVDVELLVSTV